MTDPPSNSRRVAPIPAGDRFRAWRWVALFGGLGALALGATFVLLRPRLASQIPSHYGAFGEVTATQSPLAFVLTGLLLQAAVTVVLTVVLYVSLRSGVIEQQQGPGISRLLGGLLAAMAALTVPAPLLLLLLGDAGYLALGAGAAPAVLFLVVPIVLLVVFVSVRARRGPSVRTVRFECSACGESFAPPAWRWIVGPHIGASVYLTCPRCGERGWDVRVGARVWNPNPEPADPQRLP